MLVLVQIYLKSIYLTCFSSKTAHDIDHDLAVFMQAWLTLYKTFEQTGNFINRVKKIFTDSR